MKKINLTGYPRKRVGKKESRDLRQQGYVPAVIYGGGRQKNFSVPSIELEKAIFTPDTYQIHLTVGDQKYLAILQEIQYHPINDYPIHVDMYELDENEPVNIRLPVRISGVPIGVKEGGRFANPLKRVYVRALPKEFPEAIHLDVSELGLGEFIRIKDLPYPDLEFIRDPEAVVVAVRTISEAEEEAMEAAPEEEEGEEEGAESEEKGEEAGEETGEETEEETETSSES